MKRNSTTPNAPNIANAAQITTIVLLLLLPPFLQPTMPATNPFQPCKPGFSFLRVIYPRTNPKRDVLVCQTNTSTQPRGKPKRYLTSNLRQSKQKNIFNLSTSPSVCMRYVIENQNLNKAYFFVRGRHTLENKRNCKTESLEKKKEYKTNVTFM